MKRTMSLLAVLLLLSSGLFVLMDPDDSDAYLSEFPLGITSGRIAYTDATHEIDPSEIGYFGVDTVEREISDTMFGFVKSPLNLDGLLMSGYYDMHTEGTEKNTSFENDTLTVSSYNGQMSYSFVPDETARLFRIPGNEDTSEFDAAIGHTLTSDVASVSVTVSSFDYKMFYADISEYDKTPYDDGGHNVWQVLNRTCTTRINLTYSATASVTFTDLTVKSVSMTRNYSMERTDILTHVLEHSERVIVRVSDSVSLRTGSVTLNSSSENETDNKENVSETYGNSAFYEAFPVEEYNGTGYTVRVITKDDLLEDAANAGLITNGEFGYQENVQPAEFQLNNISARISYQNAKKNIDPSEEAHSGILHFERQIWNSLFDCSRNETVNDLTISGYYDSALNSYDTGNNYTYDALVMLSLSGTMNYTFTGSGTGRLFMNPGNVDTTAFDAAIGHTNITEVSTVTVNVTSCDFKMFYYDLSEYDRTPYRNGNDYYWHVLNRTDVTRTEFSATAEVTVTFFDSSVKTVTMNIVQSLLMDETLTHASEHSGQLKYKQSIAVTFTTGDITYTSSIQNENDTGKVQINETNGDSSFGDIRTPQDKDGNGYNIRLIPRDTILKDAAEAGMITDGEYGYHEQKSDIVDNSNVTETENEVNVSFTQENAVMAEDTVNTIIAKAETKNTNVTLSLKDANIVLSPAALKRLSSDENGAVKDLQVSVKVDSKLDDALVEKAKANGLSADTVVLAISIDITSSGKTDSLGNVEVSIPFKDAKDDVSYAVYYVDNDGNYTLMKDCRIVTDSDGNKSIVFTTDHFSTFVVMPAEKDDIGNVPMYVVLGMIAVCCLYLLLGMFRKSN